MSDLAAIEFVIDAHDSIAFADLSGDHNPLHVDALAARRTQFGGTVVHGVHAVLKTLDLGASDWAAPEREPVALSVTFSNPVRTGTPVSVQRAAGSGTERLRFNASSGGRPAFTLSLSVAEAADDPVPVTAETPLPRTQPAALDFPPGEIEGAVALSADGALLASLFPALAAQRHRSWIADLLASTRIVGMECPGLHSIYSGIRLKRRGPEAGRATAMHFRVDRVDPRFRLARLAVSGRHFEGTIDTFFRPPAVQQRSLAEVAPLVEDGLFNGQRALVIGGSRGLGEAAAKILLAGGANVTVTYARGRAEAERIRGEAVRLGRACDLRPLDVTRLDATAPPDWLTGHEYTHAYFFASPAIDKNPTGRWDPAAFDGLAAIYVHAFARFAELFVKGRAAHAGKLRLFYPSTAFIDAHEPGFAEYCAAKLAGEELAQHLARTLGTTVATPRLPRLRTDQTSALVDLGAADPVPALLPLLGEFGQ